jgi:peptidoglycan/LPS O-acetylase OafA/YrhL
MQRLTRLDGLRGVLAVYVMAGHALPFTCLSGSRLAGWFGHGEAAVDLFFCLSGLVVINSLERLEFSVQPFLLARLRRLAPVYWCALGLGTALSFAGPAWTVLPWIRPDSAAAFIWVAGPPANFSWDLTAHLVFLQGLIPAGMLPWAYISLLGPAWSLSTEWQFYLVMAGFMAWRLRRGGSVPRAMTALAYAFAGLAAAYHALAGQLPPYWQFSRAFLPDAAAFFAVGLGSAIWLRGGGPRALIVTTIIATTLGFCSDAPSRGLIPLGWLVALLAQRFNQTPVLPRVLDSRPAQFLGLISYPLYLVNEPIQRAACLLLAPLTAGNEIVFTWLWLLAALGIPVAAAAALHHALETPFSQPRGRLGPTVLGFWRHRKQGQGAPPPGPPPRGDPLEPISGQ